MNVLRVGVAFDDAPDGQPEQRRLEQPDRKDGLRIGRHADQPSMPRIPREASSCSTTGVTAVVSMA